MFALAHRLDRAVLVLALLATATPALAEWQPAKGPLMTRWAKDVSPEKANGEYPRPQMVRKDWLSLNGLWEYAIRPKAEGEPDASDGRILVPFPIESALSGVMKNVGDKNRLWYRRTFEVPTDDTWRGEGKRVRLHFGAVDWECTVRVNGKQLGEAWLNGVQHGSHIGGYEPFTLDITHALKPGKLQEIVVAVWDPTDAGFQPRGKQVARPHGIWYTPVTGIWQTVWLEPVPFHGAISGLAITPNVDKESVTVRPGYAVPGGQEVVTVEVLDGERVVGSRTSPPGLIVAGSASGQDVEVAIPKPKLWSPDSPFLYDVRVVLSKRGKVLDEVRGYCGMRKISVAKDPAGVNRLMLNNKPLFQFGPLDQGWWPDGLYTAPTDEALRYDIEITKKLGFNMCRKHVKVEPARWYYWCDKLGLMVWQDMPSGDRYIGASDPDIERSADSETNFRREWQAIINANRSYPSIVAWVPFNEGWGQFKTNEILRWTKELDPARLVDGPSGWTDRGGGDMRDLHSYPGPGMPPLEDKRASVLGEFGGLGLPLAGHLWLDKGNWGYRTYKSREDLAAAYRDLIRRLRFLQADGLAAAVYTQTTDVEIEVNGLLTYDRAVVKLPEDIAQLHKQLYGPPPKVRTLVPTSEAEPQTWKYTTAKPKDEWIKPEFDDAAWATGTAGFGTRGTPGTVVRTEWKTSDIWARRTFELKSAKADGLALRIHHDEDAEVYLNGQKVAAVTGYTVSYVLVPLDDKAVKALRPGRNTLAVHCRQTGGGQYIDIGLAEVQEAASGK
jgi:hypothetical protein